MLSILVMHFSIEICAKNLFWKIVYRTIVKIDLKLLKCPVKNYYNGTRKITLPFLLIHNFAIQLDPNKSQI